MSEPRLSVRQLLDMPKGTDVLAGLPEDDLKSVRNAARGIEWSSVRSAVGENLAEALDDIDPITLFAAAWAKYSLLADAAKESAEGATVLVPLAEHEVQSELHPYVEIQLGPVTRKIEFNVTLLLKLKGVVVKVKSGEIRGIEAGTCEGSAELALADQSIWSHEFKPIALPGKMELEKGIPIR